MMRRAEVGALAVVVAATLFLGPAARASDEGTSGGVMLTLPSGARAQAMAEAYTVSEGDLNGVYYNPAVISSLGGAEAAAFYGRGYFDDRYGGLTYAAPAGPGYLAGTIRYYTTGEVTLDDGESVRTVRGMGDLLAGVSYAASLGGRLGLGGTVRVLRSTLVEDFTATALALDLGCTYSIGESGFVLGGAITNAGSDLKYRESGAPLPWSMALGALYKGNLLNAPAAAAADVVRTREGSLKARLGLEARPGGLIAVRMGYKLGYDTDDFAVGIGLRAGRLDIDYAAGIASGLDSLHLLELAYRF
jgi:hypothetical protein